MLMRPQLWLLKSYGCGPFFKKSSRNKFFLMRKLVHVLTSGWLFFLCVQGLSTRRTLWWRWEREITHTAMPHTPHSSPTMATLCSSLTTQGPSTSSVVHQGTVRRVRRWLWGSWLMSLFLSMPSLLVTMFQFRQLGSLKCSTFSLFWHVLLLM